MKARGLSTKQTMHLWRQRCSTMELLSETCSARVQPPQPLDGARRMHEKWPVVNIHMNRFIGPLPFQSVSRPPRRMADCLDG